MLVNPFDEMHSHENYEFLACIDGPTKTVNYDD